MANVTLKNLEDSTRRYDPGKRVTGINIKTEITRVIPYFGTKSILFSGLADSQSTPNKYMMTIAFYGIEFIDGAENWKKGMLEFENPQKDGTVIYVVCKKPNYNHTPVRVYCSCMDFYFVFAYPNFYKGVYFGSKPKPYKRVVPPSNRPPKNPGNIPGACKHLISFIKELQAQGYLE